MPSCATGWILTTSPARSQSRRPRPLLNRIPDDLLGHPPASDGATIRRVKKQPASFTRRKLASVVRKAITSYYTQQEQQEIAQAAQRQRISMSSFVASAALKEARRSREHSRK